MSTKGGQKRKSTRWATVPEQEKMFDLNYRVENDELDFVLNMRDGRLEFAAYKGAQRRVVNVDPKVARQSIQEQQRARGRGKKGAYWNDKEQSEGRAYHQERARGNKWYYWEHFRWERPGITFAVSACGCQECGSDEVWSLTLESRPSTGEQRLKIYAYIECCCDYEYTECDKWTFYAKAIDAAAPSPS